MNGLLALLVASCSPAPVSEAASEILPLPDTGVADTGATDTSATDTGTVDVPPDLTGLTINEFMAYDVSDGFAGGNDWIELHNGAFLLGAYCGEDNAAKGDSGRAGDDQFLYRGP